MKMMKLTGSVKNSKLQSISILNLALAAGVRTYHIQALHSDVQMSQQLSNAVSV